VSTSEGGAMKLDIYQRRAMLYKINSLVWHSHHDFLGYYRYNFTNGVIGDLIQITEREILKEWLGKGELEGQIKPMLKELTGFPLGTQLDEDTKRAFEEAKQAVVSGIDPSEAWSEWYIQSPGRDLPIVDGEIRYLGGLSDPVELCLSQARILYVGELARKSQKELLSLWGFGKKGMKEVQQVLKEKGLKLGMPLPGWTPPNKRG